MYRSRCSLVGAEYLLSKRKMPIGYLFIRIVCGAFKDTGCGVNMPGYQRGWSDQRDIFP
jgi:hypothetical protein